MGKASARSAVAAIAAAASMLCVLPAAAGQLTVDPILLELPENAPAGALNLRNDEDVPINVQTRVERWTEVDGVEKLEPANDVVSSPPIVKLAPKTSYIVRVVRLSKTPIQGEESYRVLVDQLPSAPAWQGSTVKLLIRQSIPVFFRAQQIRPPDVAWSLSSRDGRLALTATNSGDERLRIASLRLEDATGREISFGNGLVGYVLGRSSIKWILPPHTASFGAARPVSLSAHTNKGDLTALVR